MFSFCCLSTPDDVQDDVTVAPVFVVGCSIIIFIITITFLARVQKGVEDATLKSCNNSKKSEQRTKERRNRSLMNFHSSHGKFNPFLRVLTPAVRPLEVVRVRSILFCLFAFVVGTLDMIICS